MANTFTIYNNAVTFAASKAMAGLLNSHASELCSIYRAGLLNAQTAAVTGVLCQLEVRKYPATFTYTGSTAVTPTAHDSTNTAFASLTCGYNGTVGGSTGAVIRRIFWSSDEAAISSATSDELETYVPLNTIVDYTGDTNLQPLILRQYEGFVIYNTTGAAGLLDSWIEVTRT